MTVKQVFGWVVFSALLSTAGATTKYVTPSGGGSFSGDDWANAYSNVQAAINACPSASDEVRLSYGVYSNTSQLVVTNHAGLTIRGGYLGSGEDVTSTPTVLTRSLSVTNRIFYGQASTLTLDRLWVAGGLGVTNGVGVYLTNCITLVTNCVIASNSLVSTVGGVIQGGGLYATTGTLTVANSLVRNNILSGNTALGNRYGAGLFAMNAAVTLSGVAFVSNTITCVNPDYGAGAYLMGGSARITGCSFETNTIDNTWNVYGVGLGADSVRPLTISNCFFRGNSSSGTAVYYVTGGALYMGGTTLFDVSACEFVFNFLSGNAGGVYAQSKRGSAICLTGAGVGGVISDCSMTGFTNGIALEMIYADVQSTNRVTIRNTSIRGALAEGGGIFKMGAGTLILTNCLVTGTAAHGLHATVGTTIVAQCTLADNRGWGVSNAPALVAITNSVIWGNYIGGVSSTNGKYSYTCSQDALAGTGNMTNNPLFIAGYYLSAAGLPFQGADSPCIGVGSLTAEDAGLDSRTTRTDAGADSGQVDLGYHASTSTVLVVSNLNLYVDVASGSDANDGWTSGNPLKTITAALGKAIDGTAIYVATGRYYRASGEVFPLISRTPNLRIVGANRATTILDATGTNRVFSADGRGRVWFQGLTIANGQESQCAGINMLSCLSAVVTNCVFLNNRIPNATVSSWGGGLSVVNGKLTVADCVFRGNGFWNYSSSWGGGIYAVNTEAVLVRTLFETNFLGINSGAYGAAVYLSGGNAFVDSCTFSSNYLGKGYNLQGGAMCASAVSPLTISNCTFLGNNAVAFNGLAQGGALYVSGSRPLTISRCRFSGSKVGSNVGREGGTIYLTGATLAGTLSDCDISGDVGSFPEMLLIDTTGTNGLVIQNTVLTGQTGSGINKKGTGSLSLTNCLLHSIPAHAVLAGTGTVTIANSTIAASAGWGVTNNQSTVTVVNSIIRGNYAGGISSTNGSVTYTCGQESVPGPGNMIADPLLFAGFYLSVNGLPYQNADSPCINAGSGLASSFGLDTRTTRTDGAGDSGVVDLGYHAPEGTVGTLSNMVLYVDVVTGSDANNGWTPEWPLKTITAALDKTIAGSTIYVATGRYYQASGEVFPLTSRQINLTMIGANRDTTILDATGTNRVFSADGRGSIWLQGLTFTNGNAASGAGVFLPACSTVITNCTVVGNRHSTYITISGIGIYALYGTLSVVDSVVRANGTPVQVSDIYGGGIYAYGASVTLRNVGFILNYLKPNAPGQGASLYLNGGNALIEDCYFATNYMDVGHTHRGGAIYASSVNPLTIAKSSFIGNYDSGNNQYTYGGALSIIASPVVISNCSFFGNFVKTGNAGSRGGAIDLQDCKPFKIVSCIFTGNQTRIANVRLMEGSTIYVTGNAAGTIENCTIEGQKATNSAPECLSISPAVSNAVTLVNTTLRGGFGSALYKHGLGTVALTNCLIHSFTNHAIHVTTGSVVLANVTLANNSGWGVTNTTNSVVVLNSILWGNASGGITGPVSAGYTCSQEAQAGDWNMVANPLFVDEPAGNFRLRKASPCVNTGLKEDWMSTAFDLDGQPRVIGFKVDRGVYEMTSPPASGTVIMVR